MRSFVTSIRTILARSTQPLLVMAGLVPAIPLRRAQCLSKRGHRDETAKAFSSRAIQLVIIALVTAIGLLLIGQGLWIHAKALLAQVLLDRAFAHTLATGAPTKPWPWADTWPVARIEVPRLKESAIVLAGSSGQALAFGPAHLELTPDAGEPGTAVYSAHRDTHFAFLGKVVADDEIRVTRSDGATFRYRVTGMTVVHANQSDIDPLAAGRNLILSTCWPLDAKVSGPMRYLVHAEIDGDVAVVPQAKVE